MIRVGIGGWTFEPWRDGVFFPKGLAHAKELSYASRAVTSIEVNGTFYSTMKPATFKKWHDEAPDDFVFSLKAPRYAVNRRVLGEAGDSINRFFESGVSELGPKLGPILWQFAGTKKYDPDDFSAFLSLLPEKTGGLKLHHAVEPRHESFANPDFIALARKHKVAVVIADHEKYPPINDVTADFIYARLQRAEADVRTGYKPAILGKWETRAKAWAAGEGETDLKLVAKPPAKAKSRDVFVYMINGAKERAPAAAQALLKRLAK